MSFSLHFSFNFSEEADDELPLLRAVPITTQLRVCGRGCARCGSLLHPKYRARISSYTRYYCTSLYVTYRPAVSLGRTIFTTCPLFKPKYRATGSPACMRGSWWSFSLYRSRSSCFSSGVSTTCSGTSYKNEKSNYAKARSGCYSIATLARPLTPRPCTPSIFAVASPDLQANYSSGTISNDVPSRYEFLPFSSISSNWIC